jgi:hypothetical protein
MRIEVPDERNHVDYRPGGKSRHGGRAEVVDLGAAEQRLYPLALSCKEVRPCRVVLHDLDRGVPAAAEREVFCCGMGTHDRVGSSWSCLVIVTPQHRL